MKTKISDIRIEPAEGGGYTIRCSLETEVKGEAKMPMCGPGSRYENKTYVASSMDELMGRLKELLPKKKAPAPMY